ncbi:MULTISPECIES: hypothetical protein [Micromonospora]|uniref:Tat pathway signal sequence domain protein n=1 Tax=Micromonospora solifontis TaxID=2487138 RepID=A0ABX9WGF5_9ACTN|nr:MULTISPECIES: hypothetical protein [Micromonospora]NES16398.1 hypothetical protein [Micromonospora sp. PPF5-17B]NES37249.1 hypothetical protein [Micromonospora solifontis]NES57114.1 hypothetical protein [Micromonospora sp. PPF5-6]RNL98598.1 hypothetical protein EFE23_13945 [Micromonospora solifontis]
MTTDLEDQLIAGMRDEAAGLTFRRDVLGDATRRHQRRTMVHRSAYAAGVAGVAGALAAALTVGAGGTAGSPGPVAERPATAASPESPQMRLAAAAAASENISYRVKVTTTNKDKLPPRGELPEPVARTWVTTGAFDPATATGYLDSPNTGLRPPMSIGWLKERLVEGVLYHGGLDGADPDSGRVVWSRDPEGRQTSLDFDDALGGRLGTSTDPQQLFRMLRQAGAQVTQNPGGGYHFEVTVQDSSRGVAADRLVGDVTVDADGRIKTVAYDRAARWNARGPEFTYHLHVLVELSDYGLPVQVEAPANAIVIGK